MTKNSQSSPEGVLTTKNIKDKMVEYYIDSLSHNQIPWQKGWRADRHFNAVTEGQYHGVNYLTLQFVSLIKGYTDPRWCTVKQANSKGWKVKTKPIDVKDKGEIYGVPLQYWMPCQLNEQGKFQKWITWDTYHDMKDDPENKISVDVRSKTFYVFNAQEIEGIPAYESPQHSQDIQASPFIDHLIKQMKVQYKECGDEAYYRPSTDTVVIPPKDTFYSEYDYHATRLHELCHATGNPNRLGRKIENPFGSENYAREELRAEIASSFLSLDIGLPLSEEHLKNHAAYIQSWIQILKENPHELFQAIKTADDIEKYALEVGEWDKFKEKENALEASTLEVLQETTVSPFEELLATVNHFLRDVDLYEYRDQDYSPEDFSDIEKDLQNGGEALQSYIQELREEEAITPEQDQEAEKILSLLEQIQREKELERD